MLPVPTVPPRIIVPLVGGITVKPAVPTVTTSPVVLLPLIVVTPVIFTFAALIFVDATALMSLLPELFAVNTPVIVVLPAAKLERLAPTSKVSVPFDDNTF